MNSFAWRYMANVTGLALAYFVVGELSLPFPYSNAPVSIVWLPAGVALAAILLGGYRLWPGIALGAALTGVAHDAPLVTIALNALGSSLATVAGAWVLQAWTDFDRQLRRVRDVLVLSGLGAMAAAGVGGALKTLALFLDNQIELAVLGRVWAIAWLPDALGMLLVTPVLLVWAAEWRSRSWRSHPGETATVFLALTLASGISFGGWLDISGDQHLPLAFLPFPFLMWIAMRLAMPWVVTAAVLTAGVALVGTTSGHGPFAYHSSAVGTATLWSFMIMVALTMLLVGVGMAERRRAEKRWVHAVESNPNAVVLVDHAGKIVLINSQTMRLFGYGRHELIGQSIEILMPARFRTGHEGYRTGFWAGQPPVRPMGMGRDLYALRKDGSEFPVEVGLATIETEEETLTISVIADITLRKQAKLALHEERNFVSAVLGTVAALVVVTDAAGCIVRLNRACEETTGHTLEDVKGRPLDIFLPPDEIGRVREAMDELRAGRVPYHFEAHWLTKDGTPRLIAWSNTVLRGPDGSVQHLVGTGIDITEQRRAEVQAIQRQAALAHIDRLAAAGELAASLAHELNQPLSAVTTYCDTALALVQSAPDPVAEVVYALDQACEQAERASAIIRHLRTFVRKGSTQKASADINTVIKDTVRFVETEARHRRVRIHLELAKALPPLLLDTVQIEQVLVNLLRNSFEAMAAANSPRCEVTIRSQSLGEKVQVTVCDTGPGLKIKTFDQLFDIFETTKSEGLGLGLSISRSIIEAHGGELWAEPASAQGATFAFTLPVTAENRHDSAAAYRVSG